MWNHPCLRLSSPFCLFSPFFFPHPRKHTPLKHPNHPASPDMWTRHLVHLRLSPCLLYFHPVCFHSPSFRVITWHLHCKVPFAALSSSAGDWASFPRQIRERERERKERNEWREGLQWGVMLFWLAGYMNNGLVSFLLVKLAGLEQAQECFKLSHVNNHHHFCAWWKME